MSEIDTRAAAEREVLAAVLLEPVVLSLVAPLVRPEDFADRAHAWTYQAMLDLDADGIPLDIVSLAERLRTARRLADVGGAAFLGDLTDAGATTAHVEHHARQVAAFARARRVVAAARAVLSRAREPGAKPEALVEFAERTLGDAARDVTARGAVSLGELIEQSFAEMEARALGGGPPRAESGLYALDRLLGGFGPGQLIVLAARPAVGKTSFAMGAALHVARTAGPALVLSLEMHARELSDRLLFGEAGVDMGKLKRPGAISPAETARLLEAGQRLHPAPLWVIDQPDVTLPALRARAAAHARRHGLRLLVIDYLQLVQAPGFKPEQRAQAVASIARGLKELAKQLGAPILALAQLNRAVEVRGKDATPRLSDLGESGEIEKAADAVVFITRDEQDRGAAEFVVAKNRSGPEGIARARFDATRTRFRDAPAAVAPLRAASDEPEGGDDDDR